MGDRTGAWSGLCWGRTVSARRGPAGRGAGGQGTPPQTHTKDGGRLPPPTATFLDMPGYDSPEHLRETIWPEAQLFLQSRGGSRRLGRGPPKDLEGGQGQSSGADRGGLWCSPHLHPACLPALGPSSLAALQDSVLLRLITPGGHGP